MAVFSAESKLHPRGFPAGSLSTAVSPWLQRVGPGAGGVHTATEGGAGRQEAAPLTRAAVCLLRQEGQFLGGRDLLSPFQAQVLCRMASFPATQSVDVSKGASVPSQPWSDRPITIPWAAGLSSSACPTKAQLPGDRHRPGAPPAGPVTLAEPPCPPRSSDPVQRAERPHVPSRGCTRGRLKADSGKLQAPNPRTERSHWLLVMSPSPAPRWAPGWRHCGSQSPLALDLEVGGPQSWVSERGGVEGLL